MPPPLHQQLDFYDCGAEGKPDGASVVCHVLALITTDIKTHRTHGVKLGATDMGKVLGYLINFPTEQSRKKLSKNS